MCCVLVLLSKCPPQLPMICLPSRPFKTLIVMRNDSSSGVETLLQPWNVSGLRRRLTLPKSVPLFCMKREDRRLSLIEISPRLTNGTVLKPSRGRPMEIALWPASTLNLPAKILVYKNLPLQFYVLPLQPLATRGTPKLDHCMPMVFAEMAFIPKSQQERSMI